eukprot:m.22494 g.22494  ORF g.22494 m.22494 type:complete len:287 (+) comp8396_c0_seq1:377-1237(+)
MGVSECDNVLMLLALSLEMTKQQRNVVTPLVMEGFRDLCLEAGTTVNGGQTVLNPWLIVGGVASYVAKDSDFIEPTGAQLGDVLVLTKPLGTQPAVNAHQWLHTGGFDRIAQDLTPEDAIKAYKMAMHSMSRLNRTAARLMHKYNAHGSTDVTGFGILGHAKNLAEAQLADVDFEIDTLPCFPKMVEVNSKFNFKLTEGFSAETSGGLLIAIPQDQAEGFCTEIEAIDGVPAWIIGRVVDGTKTARLTEDCKVMEVVTPEVRSSRYAPMVMFGLLSLRGPVKFPSR